MNNKLKNITKLFITVLFAFSIFSLISCEPVEEVSLDSAGVQSIAITRLPDKLKYKKTDTVLDTTGLIVTATYRSGTTKVIPNSELTFKGFKEYEGDITSSETIYVYYKAGTDKSRFCTFTITYGDETGISVAVQPNKVKYSRNEVLDFTGLELNVQYADNSMKTVFSDDIFKNLKTISDDERNKITDFTGAESFGRRWYEQLESSVESAATLTIPLAWKTDDGFEDDCIDAKDDKVCVKGLTFLGFDSTLSASSQTVRIRYVDNTGDEKFVREASFNITYTDLNNISVTSNPSSVSYVMNVDTSTGINGGIGRTGVNRNTAKDPLFDIKDWHFNVDGLELTLNYMNTAKKLTFTNTSDEYCYGSGTKDDCAYVTDKNGNLQYMQRWANETDSDGQRYKIKIEGFDPIAQFTTVKDTLSSIPQTLTISYTEGSVTCKAAIQISYTFGATYTRTEKPKWLDDEHYEVLFGDYPQTLIKSTVKVNKTKLDNGLYSYQLGSDGNYYCKKTESGNYYQVEPIAWLRLNKPTASQYFYYSQNILDAGIPYYQGKADRTNQKSVDYVWIYGDHRDGGDGKDRDSPATVTYTYNLDKFSFIYSTIRNWLNGDNQNGDSTYNSKGFLQTAFTSSAQQQLGKIPVTEYCKTAIKASGTCVGTDGVTVGTHEGIANIEEGFVYKEESAVSVIIPGYEETTPYTVMKEYDTESYNSKGPATRINEAEAKTSPEFFSRPDFPDYAADNHFGVNDSYKINDYWKRNDIKLEGSDFTGEKDNFWLATDAMCTASGSAWMDTDKADTWNISTLKQTAVSTESEEPGIIPVIKLFY